MERNIFFTGDPMSKQPQELMKTYLTPLAKNLDTDIILCLCHGKMENFPSEMDFDKLYIFIQLLPNEFEGVKKHTVSGCQIGEEKILYPIKKDAVQPCPQGDSLIYAKCPERTVIIRDDAGQPMAVVIDNGIYIMNDCVHARDSEEFEIGQRVFAYIIDKTIAEGSLIGYLKGGIEQKSKKCLENALKLQFTQRLDKERIQLKAAQDTVIQYEKGIVDGERKIIATEKIVEAIQRNISDIPTALDKTWGSLMRMKAGPHYTNVSFGVNGIKAVTSPISVIYDGKEYEMGRFEVSLSFDGQCIVKTLQVPPVVPPYDHPHINNGKVCWGNFAGYIPKLIGSSEFDVALIQIHTFLSHYDEGNPHKNISYWPAKKTKTTTEEKMEVTF